MEEKTKREYIALRNIYNKIYIFVFCRMTDRTTDQITDKLNAHWYIKTIFANS